MICNNIMFARGTSRMDLLLLFLIMMLYILIVQKIKNKL